MEMKILVVEDEIKTLNGITNLIEEIGFGFDVAGKARSGEEGIELILEKRPDIVITDIQMNGMTGLEMIKILNERKYQGRYIILSGYAEFQYAREAITLGSMDYLLKPITKEILEESLKKVRDAIVEEEQKIHPGDMGMDQLLERAFFMPGFMESKMELELLKRLKGKTTPYLLLIRGENRIVDQDFQKMITRLEEEFEDREFYSCRSNGSKENYIFFPEAAKHMTEVLDETVGYCREEVNAYVIFAAMQVENVCELKEAREKILDMTNWNLSLKQAALITGERIKELKPQRFQYPSDLEHLIINDINSGQIDEIEGRLQEFRKYVEKEVYAYKDIRESMICLTAAVLYAIRRASYGLYENISNLNILEWVGNSLFVENYTQMLMNVIRQYEKYTRNLKTGNHPIVNKVLKILEKEYKNELTLEEMAERMDVTPEYLSGLFMKELGVKYTTYRAQIRIDAAKKLLKTGKLKSYEVAEECGFSDVRYFTKVFKKFTGVSPGEYVRTMVNE
ncbi:MAG TPA: response regulator [Candidatus Pelethocola excrementipullorum]|nr:response regulator [Candidatus Pelethocola excrementipullorum]